MAEPRKWNDEIEKAVMSYQGQMTPLAKVLSRLTNRSIDRLQDDISRMLERGRYRGQDAVVFLNGQADADTAKRMSELIEMAPERLRPRLKKAIVAQIADHRMTNRSAIRTLAKLNAYSVMDDMLQSTARILSTTATDGYLRGTFILQKEARTAWNVDGMISGRNQIIVDTVVRLADAKRYMDPVADMSSKVVVDSMLRGLPPDEVAKSVDDVKGAVQFRSKREARTKLTQAAQLGHREAYEEHGVKMYVFRCTYDERTCGVCGDMDGKKYPVMEAEAGRNYPPMHPNCRCTTIAALSEEVKKSMAKRVVRDTATGEIVEVPQDFTYEDWYKRFGPGRTDGKQYRPKKR